MYEINLFIHFISYFVVVVVDPYLHQIIGILHFFSFFMWFKEKQKVKIYRYPNINYQTYTRIL